jgi:hypothetical protein
MKNRPDPTEEELILHFYGESADPRSIDAALAADAGLASRFEALGRDLTAAGTLAAPEPPADLSDRVWREIRPQLRREFRWAAVFQAGPGRSPWLTLVPASLALVAALAIGYLAGSSGSGDEARGSGAIAAGEASPTGLSPAARERLLLASVEGHLAGSERLLTRVANAAPTDAAALAQESAWAEALVSSNRLYRRAAERSGQRRIVALLDELEPLLLELAHGGEAAPDDLEAAQQRIDNTDLLFKLRVTGERLQRDAGASRAAKSHVRTVS